MCILIRDFYGICLHGYDYGEKYREIMRNRMFVFPVNENYIVLEIIFF